MLQSIFRVTLTIKVRSRSCVESEVNKLPVAGKTMRFRHGGRQFRASFVPLSLYDQSLMFFSRMLVSTLSQGCNLKAWVHQKWWLRFHLTQDDKTPKTKYLVKGKENRPAQSHLHLNDSRFALGFACVVWKRTMGKVRHQKWYFSFLTWNMSPNLGPNLVLNCDPGFGQKCGSELAPELVLICFCAIVILGVFRTSMLQIWLRIWPPDAVRNATQNAAFNE